MVKKNIIFLENNMVSLIRHKGDKIEFIKKDGETDFEINEGFWTWWKEAVSYLEDDETDFCFIYDRDYSILHDEFLNKVKRVEAKDSLWDINYIRNFFWELRPTYFNVCLIDEESRKVYLSDNKQGAVPAKEFYTNMRFDNVQAAKKDVTGSTENNDVRKGAEQFDESEISDIAKYFVDLIRKERGYD